MLTLIHWFCCAWGLLAVLHGSQRTPELAAAAAAATGVGGGVGGVGGGLTAGGADEGSSSSSSFHPACLPGLGDCLSSCEVGLLASMRGEDFPQVQRHENWLCRARAEHALRPPPLGAPTETYLYLLHTSGFITPTNAPEHVLYFFLSFMMLVVSNIFVGVIAGVQVLPS